MPGFSDFIQYFFDHQSEFQYDFSKAIAETKFSELQDKYDMAKEIGTLCTAVLMSMLRQYHAWLNENATTK